MRNEEDFINEKGTSRPNNDEHNQTEGHNSNL